MTALDRNPRRHPERIVRSYSSMSSAQRAAQTAACAGGSSATAATREPARKQLPGLPGNAYPNTGAGRALRAFSPRAGLLCAPDRSVTVTLDEIPELARATRSDRAAVACASAVCMLPPNMLLCGTPSRSRRGAGAGNGRSLSPTAPYR